MVKNLVIFCSIMREIHTKAIFLKMKMLLIFQRTLIFLDFWNLAISRGFAVSLIYCLKPIWTRFFFSILCQNLQKNQLIYTFLSPFLVFINLFMKIPDIKFYLDWFWTPICYLAPNTPSKQPYLSYLFESPYRE